MEQADDTLTEKIKKAVCRIAELLNDIELSENASRQSIGYEQTEAGNRGKVISSVSSGNESISYQSGTTSSTTTLAGAVLTDKKAQDVLFLECAREYLGGTGLLYAGL
jgi:hypothetical protein